MRKFLIMAVLLAASTSWSSPITAQSWLVTDEKGKIIQGENTKQVRSIASITKLMTVMVVLDAKQNMRDKIGQFTRKELIQMVLVRSNNEAARKLCEEYPGGTVACVRAMNSKVYLMGLSETKYVDPTGLNIMNVSTAEELVDIVQEASNYPLIVESSKLSEVKIKIRKKWLVFRNTNPIIGKKYEFVVSKTGYITASGGCIVMMLDTDVGRRTVVLLGSKNTHTRIPEAEFIFNTYN